MAFFDDPKMLAAHMRHSFITSDSSGMSELIMINEDIDKEIKSDHTFQKRSVRHAQLYNPTEHFPRVVGKSYDIEASPTLSGRPPLKNTSNMFQIMEERRKKRGVQCKSIVWQDGTPLSFEPSFFQRREVSKRDPVKKSVLALLLAESSKQAGNPFLKYSKYNGENHASGSTCTFEVFLSMVKDLDPIRVTVILNATVEDLIGLTFWKYIEECEDEPVELKAVEKYAVMIAEEDGEIDTDLPALEREDRVSKFGFKYLGIVQENDKKADSKVKHITVKVHYEQGGFSTILVDTMDVEMSEILSKVIRKRRLQIQGYELEKKETPGLVVDLNSTLKQQNTLDFVLVGRRIPSPSESPDALPKDFGGMLTSVRAELTSHQYKSYSVTLLHKVRANTEVHLGVSSDGIEIDPMGQTKLFRSAAKPSTYEMKKICACQVVEDKGSKMVFRIIRQGKDGNYKNHDFEATSPVAKEIVHKINLILDGMTSEAKVDYLGGRKIART
ncbi:hypothetical protein EMCRGX_G001403 [Ephydatia muelleri]